MSIANYELNCISADHIELVKAQKDSSYRYVPSNNQPPSFPSTQPLPPKAPPKGCGCVSLNNNAHKDTGLSGISAAKKHIFGGRQIVGKPCIQAVFQALIRFLHSSSILRTQHGLRG
jgi:hypothetical protein